MTSTDAYSLEQEMDSPWGGPSSLSIEEQERLALEREQVRQRLVEAHSSSPLYQARAAKDPDYWNSFYVGRVS